ncbi:hypothetical protein [Ornithinicoccus halotolerans]|uniref:hypothetical protein n=1 Tax=Ornithinicoccus halotolerans TaxID=1748220 RepID=UPI001294D34B|nr:hypothetical protein [Ornithinicoccus halotolerans]
MTTTRLRRRLLGVAAGAAAVTLVTATTASAHFCYVANMSDAARQALASNNSVFVELSDVAEMFVLPPSCQGLGLGDAAVAEWMAAFGVEQEPMIHSRAVMAKGAMGKSQGINHLSDADFAFLDGALTDGVMEVGCL